ncbi:hypothetical protein DXG03_000489 [Asterophora parasitica]|uniref:Uncharacterized protein n=1 Tax=Asterophora parasitica TaxID=117018 RepID=A0A9P7GEX6_9AGAR|nr:hypothetical protein DXG03_000489 [Asterophora parasitica]
MVKLPGFIKLTVSLPVTLSLYTNADGLVRTTATPTMALEGNNETEDILQAVLSHAFSPPPSRRQSVRASAETEIATASTSTETDKSAVEPLAESSISSGSADDSWKAEYESQVEAWRAQSSEAREKAEKERERWEALRAAERVEAQRRKALGIVEPVPEPTEHEHGDAGWENVEHRTGPSTTISFSSAVSERSASPNPADARDLVTGESEHEAVSVLNAASTTIATTASNTPALEPPTQITRAHSHADTGDGLQKWEDIQSSITSSFPSMSYPERTETPSPSRQQPAPPAPATLSATLAVFDSSLSTRTRVTALFSSLAINMLLPFVNGVMLGFGEIFAKNVVMGWFGWKPAGPGYVATTAGIGASTSPRTPWGQRKQS